MLMSRRRASNIEKASTSFERWRLMLSLTQAEAAEKLGKSRRAVQNYERPDPKTNKTATPDYAVRVLMQILAQGGTPPTEWPE
jgi:transcriptional regulator with XRE-family HTH domain